jgi:MIP family channel proteins
MTFTPLDRRRIVAEAIGTFFLVLIGPGAAMVNAWSGGGLGVVGIALAFAFVIIAMIYALGHISGAHINPAVTIAFWSVRRFPAREVAPYIIAQCVGAAAASAVLRAVLGPVGQLGATLPGISVSSAFVVEWLLSFALMLVIMAVATGDRFAPGFPAIAVGLTVGFCALTGGPLTGASMNPARSFGPALVGGLWRAHWVYWLAPITAMVAAARLYDWLGYDELVVGSDVPERHPRRGKGEPRGARRIEQDQPTHAARPFAEHPQA